jgi:hypothetical protein
MKDDLFIIQVYDEEQGLWLDINMGGDWFHLLNAYKFATEDEPNRKFRLVKVMFNS